MNYDPVKFWIKEGEGPTTLKDPGRIPQENHIVNLLKKCGDFKSFLDLGCGFGRICHLVLENFPYTEVVHGVDVSTTRLSNAARDCKPFGGIGIGPEIEFFRSELLNFNPDRKYDVVFSCEVLMHALPKDIRAHIDKTIELSNSHVINVDWWEATKPTYEIAEWNFMHDYPGIYEDLVLQGKIKQMRSYNIGDKQFIFHSIK